MEAEIRAFLDSLETQSSYSKSTRLAYASDLRSFSSFLQRCLSRAPLLSDFNSQQICLFVRAEQQAGRMISTLRRRQACLRRFQLFLQQKGHLPIEKDGWFDLKAETKPAQDRLIPASLTDAQISSLFTCMQASGRALARRDEAILSTMLMTGMAVSSIVALDLSDLDLRLGKIHLQTEAGEDLWMPLGEAAQKISIYLHDGRPDLNPILNQPALFISQTGSRMSRQSIWQMLGHWGRIAQLSMKLSPRLVRHTAARRLAQSGRPVSEIQRLLGHTNPLSTQALLHRLGVHFSRPQG